MTNRPTHANLSMIQYATKCLQELSRVEVEGLHYVLLVSPNVLKSALQQRLGHMKATELAEGAIAAGVNTQLELDFDV